MSNINTYCKICGVGYTTCGYCTESKIKPWRSVVDTIEHYKIYYTISNYTNQRITKEEAKKDLVQCKIEDYKTFLPEIVNIINEILKVKSINKKSRKKIDTTKESVKENNKKFIDNKMNSDLND